MCRECLNLCLTRRSAEKQARVITTIRIPDMNVPILVLGVVSVHEVAVEVAVTVVRVIIAVKENNNNDNNNNSNKERKSICLCENRDYFWILFVLTSICHYCVYVVNEFIGILFNSFALYCTSQFCAHCHLLERGSVFPYTSSIWEAI